MIALDTNLLVYAHRSAVAEHRSARQAIVRARTSSGGWGFSLPVVGEFWSVVTHPTAAGRPSAPEEAHRFIVALEAAGAEIWTPGAGFAARRTQLAIDLSVTGPSDLRSADRADGVRRRSDRAVDRRDRRFVSVPGSRSCLRSKPLRNQMKTMTTIDARATRGIPGKESGWRYASTTAGWPTGFRPS